MVRPRLQSPRLASEQAAIERPSREEAKVLAAWLSAMSCLVARSTPTHMSTVPTNPSWPNGGEVACPIQL